MQSDKWVVQCFSFANSNDYEKAKKEQETVAYIKSNTNLSNIKVVAKLYSSLIEKETFDTIIGYTFLQELRQLLLSQDMITEAALPPIPVDAKEAKLLKETVANEQLEKYKNLYIKTSHKKKISLYANFFLVTIVIIMMILSVMTKSQANGKFEEKILNQYASWKQELQQKEEELDKRENILNQLQVDK